MAVIDFDMGLAQRVGDLYSAPTIPVEFMPEDLFERKRIVDKIRNKDTFSFISFWRSGFIFDPSRFDPAEMYDYTTGYYNDVDRTSATFFQIFPVIFDYAFVIWETKREMLDLHAAILFKNIMLNTILTVNATDASVQMNCYIDMDYRLNITDEYVLEKGDKVPYFKGKFEFKLEGWLYNIVAPGSGSGPELDIIRRVHTFVYNQNKFFMEDIWVPDELPGYPEGEEGLPEGAEL